MSKKIHITVLHIFSIRRLKSPIRFFYLFILIIDIVKIYIVYMGPKYINIILNLPQQ